MIRLLERLADMRSEERPVRFLLSRVLWATRLCRWFYINKQAYRLHFHPSSVAALYWAYPDARAADEEFLRRYLRPGDRVVDVGANIGTLTACAASVVGPTGRVWAIEPHPRIHRYLQANMRLNQFTNVATYQCAIGEDGDGISFEDRRADDMNAVNSSGTLLVPQKRLDDLGIEGGRVALLKVDVEGYELHVLKGGVSVLQHTQTVLIECSQDHFKRYGYETSDVLGLLWDAGFSCLALDELGVLTNVRRNHISRRVENLIATRNTKEFAERTGYRLNA